MSNNKTIYNPSQPEIWTPEKHQKFYDELKEYIEKWLQEILPSIDLDTARQYLDYFFVTDKEKNTDEDKPNFEERFALEQKIEYNYITIKNFTFPPQKDDWLPNYNNLFHKLVNIIFENCDFYNTNIDIEYPTYFLSFKDCVFHEPWEHNLYLNSSQREPLFSDCNFKNGVSIYCGLIDHFSNIFSACDIDLLLVENITLENWLFKKNNQSKVKKLHIYNSNIEQEIFLKLQNLEEVHFQDSTFESDIDFSESLIKILQITRTKFKKSCNFTQTSIDRINHKEVEYEGFSLFEGCQLGNPDLNDIDESLSFDQVTFHKAANFRDAEFYQKLDLRNTIFLQTPTFLGSTFKQQARLETDRETFRIIKQAFIAVNNQIEADRIYAYEMHSYHHELRKAGAKYYPDRILLGFNSYISNHGQNYLRAVFWLCLCILIISLVLSNDKHQWIPTNYPGPVWWQTIRDALNGFALGFLPLTGLYTGREHLAFFLMLATFTLSGITWHLLVAIRRHRRQ